MKEFRIFAFLLSFAILLTFCPFAMADPIYSADKIKSTGTVCNNQTDINNAVPQKITDNGNSYGVENFWGSNGLGIRFGKYAGYASTDKITVQVETQADIKQGDVIIISFHSSTFWSPDGKMYYQFGLRNDSHLQKTDVIVADKDFSDATLKWSKYTYYAFQADADYPKGSSFEMYLGFTNYQQGILCDFELRDIGTTYSFEQVKYSLGMTTLNQNTVFSYASGYKIMAVNDAINLSFNEPVADFNLDDFSIDDGAAISSFEQSVDKRLLTLHFSGLKTNTAYKLNIDNVITKEIDYRKLTFNFTTGDDFVVDTDSLSSLVLTAGTNTINLKVDNTTASPTDTYLIAAVYTGTADNYSKADTVSVVKKSEVGAFETITIDVPITDPSKQFVKFYIWNNLSEKAPLCDEITLGAN